MIVTRNEIVDGVIQHVYQLILMSNTQVTEAPLLKKCN